jgi:phosphoribosylanthranilate isomerase
VTRTLVKICGICDVEGGLAAVAAGADLLGFHFCSSSRRVTPEQALAIIAALPRRPQIVGVFIDQPEAEVDKISRFCGLDLAQLHGSERAGYRVGVPVMKALKVKDGTPPEAGDWPDPLLIDSWSPDQRGGTGRTWDWELARALLKTRRVFLAGGLNPANVGEVVRRCRPSGVDVSSGVEAAPRVKDPERVAAFVRAVREADESR